MKIGAANQRAEMPIPAEMRCLGAQQWPLLVGDHAHGQAPCPGLQRCRRARHGLQDLQMAGAHLSVEDIARPFPFSTKQFRKAFAQSTPHIGENLSAIPKRQAKFPEGSI
jgi:hypothetical protein